MMEEELLEKIVRGLETQKALIVIDDIWRERRRLGPNQACVSAKKGDSPYVTHTLLTFSQCLKKILQLLFH